MDNLARKFGTRNPSDLNGSFGYDLSGFVNLVDFKLLEAMTDLIDESYKSDASLYSITTKHSRHSKFLDFLFTSFPEEKVLNFTRCDSDDIESIMLEYRRYLRRYSSSSPRTQSNDLSSAVTMLKQLSIRKVIPTFTAPKPIKFPKVSKLDVIEKLSEQLISNEEVKRASVIYDFEKSGLSDEIKKAITLALEFSDEAIDSVEDLRDVLLSFTDLILSDAKQEIALAIYRFMKEVSTHKRKVEHISKGSIASLFPRVSNNAQKDIKARLRRQNTTFDCSIYDYVKRCVENFEGDDEVKDIVKQYSSANGTYKPLFRKHFWFYDRLKTKDKVRLFYLICDISKAIPMERRFPIEKMLLMNVIAALLSGLRAEYKEVPQLKDFIKPLIPSRDDLVMYFGWLLIRFALNPSTAVRAKKGSLKSHKDKFHLILDKPRAGAFSNFESYFDDPRNTFSFEVDGNERSLNFHDVHHFFSGFSAKYQDITVSHFRSSIFLDKQVFSEDSVEEYMPLTRVAYGNLSLKFSQFMGTLQQVKRLKDSTSNKDEKKLVINPENLRPTILLSVALSSDNFIDSVMELSQWSTPELALKYTAKAGGIAEFTSSIEGFMAHFQDILVRKNPKLFETTSPLKENLLGDLLVLTQTGTGCTGAYKSPFAEQGKLCSKISKCPKCEHFSPISDDLSESNIAAMILFSRHLEKQEDMMIRDHPNVWYEDWIFWRVSLQIALSKMEEHPTLSFMMQNANALIKASKISINYPDLYELV